MVKTELSKQSIDKAKTAIKRRDLRYYDYLAQTGQLAGNADNTKPFILGLARAIQNGDV